MKFTVVYSHDIVQYKLSSSYFLYENKASVDLFQNHILQWLGREWESIEDYPEASRGREGLNRGRGQIQLLNFGN